MGKQSKKTDDRKKLLSMTDSVLDKGKKLRNKELDIEDKRNLISLLRTEMKRISQILALSSIKGKGGVITSITSILLLIDDLEVTLDNEEELREEQYNAFDYIAYRIKNKMCERLFPDGNIYINDRMKRLEIQRRTLRLVIVSKIMESSISDQLDEYEGVYIYEEDEESLLLAGVMQDLGVEKIKGMISDSDAFNLNGIKILSFEEAKLSKRDVLIVCSPKYMRKYDCKVVQRNGIENLILLDLYD